MLLNLLFFFFVVILNSVFCKPMVDVTKFSPEVRGLVKELHNSCKAKTNTEEIVLQQGNKGIFENDDKLKLYLLCIWEESALMKDGELDREALVEIFPGDYKDIIPKLFMACFDKFPNEKSTPDRVLKMYKCVLEADPEV
ncbi:unnamed protein product, partial [Psylliodes chrysocephalus]